MAQQLGMITDKRRQELYKADVAQRRVQASLERRGKRAGQPTDSGQAAEAAGR